VVHACRPDSDVPARPAGLAAAYHQASGRPEAMTPALSRPVPPMVATVDAASSRGEVISRTPPGDYPKAVTKAKEAIRDGECFQIVVAQRFERETTADPLDVYREI